MSRLRFDGEELEGTTYPTSVGEGPKVSADVFEVHPDTFGYLVLAADFQASGRSSRPRVSGSM